jgi:hypothetical protein
MYRCSAPPPHKPWDDDGVIYQLIANSNPHVRNMASDDDYYNAYDDDMDDSDGAVATDGEYDANGGLSEKDEPTPEEPPAKFSVSTRPIH